MSFTADAFRVLIASIDSEIYEGMLKAMQQTEKK
jgi:hypothetical protein